MLSSNIARTIRKIEIRSTRLAQEQLAGGYRSVFVGGGVNFSEVREYVPGDDVRCIDWNVSARTSRVHTKLFREERHRIIMLLVDMSASGLFGSQPQSKREVAAEVAAMLAFAAIANNDQVGLVLFSDQIELFLPPKTGKKHVLRLVREIILFAPASRATDIGVALTFLARVMKRPVVGFVVSDFLTQEWSKPFGLASRRHDLIPVVVSDPLEAGLPRLGLFCFEDLETGALVEFDTSGPEGAAYRVLATQANEHRAQQMRDLSLDVIAIPTNTPPGDVLVRFFQQRRKQRRGRR